MGWFSEDKEAEPKTVEAELISTKSAIHNLSFEDGELVAKSPDGDQPEGQATSEKKITGDDIMRLVPPEKFHGLALRGLNYVGKRKQLNSLKVDKTNEDFQAACEVLYRRVSDSAAGPLIAKLSNQTIEDGLLIIMGIGPIAMGCFEEIKDRKQQPKPEPEKKTNEEAEVKENV